MKLNESVKLISLQFSFTNPDALPRMARAMSSETPEEHGARVAAQKTGELVVQPTESCSVIAFTEDLLSAGYMLVDVIYQERILPRRMVGPRRDQKTYHMVRFLFARKECAEPSETFLKLHDTLLAELREMCRTALWRVRVFSNPFYKNGEETPGLQTASVNFEARVPLFRRDGEPVLVWEKDEHGERLGEKPLPLRGNCRLSVANNSIQLLR